MKTQLEHAKAGIITEQMTKVAEEENFTPETIRERVATGEIVIPNNPKRPIQKVTGIGLGLRTKVNASIGTSSDICDIGLEKRRAQMVEMIINCELAESGRNLGCQMMVEGPGHIPLDEIEANIILEKRMSGNAPYYVLRSLPIDSGAGYDHVTAAIGAANASRYGADLICYITPAEHLAQPNEDDVREGVRVTRLAARIGDIAKYPERRNHEKKVALSRRDMRWADLMNLLMFPDRARQIRTDRIPGDSQTCSMCGDFCAMQRGSALFKKDLRGDKAA